MHGWPVLPLLSDDRSRQALCIAELHALRKAKRQELKMAERASRTAALEIGGKEGYFAAVAASVAATLIRPEIAAEQAAWFAASETGSWGGRVEELAAHADILREIFGNPFRPIVAVGWLGAVARWSNSPKTSMIGKISTCSQSSGTL